MREAQATSGRGTLGVVVSETKVSASEAYALARRKGMRVAQVTSRELRPDGALGPETPAWWVFGDPRPPEFPDTEAVLEYLEAQPDA